jgi:hypothetical protein
MNGLAAVIAGFIGAMIGRPKGGAAREREIVSKGIQKSMKDLDDELWQLQVTGIDLDSGEKKRVKGEVARLEAMMAGLIQAGREINSVPEEEWDTFRDETLNVLDQARQYFREAEAATKAA